MLVRALLLASVLSAGAWCQPDAPDPAEQKSIVARMRDAVVGYADRLQDFICIQTTTRSADDSGSGKHWKLLETQELELRYVAHKEHYRLLKVNGQSTNPEKRVKKGYFIPRGEFGSALRMIFDPKAQAEFEWDHGEQAAGKRQCVFRYQVQRSTTTLVMQADMDRVPLAHHGLVYADCDTGMAMRIQFESEPGTVVRRGHEIRIGSKLDVRYGLTAIASKEFLLPQVAEEVAIFGKTLTKAEIQFQQYRKYEASSTISFGEGETKH